MTETAPRQPANDGSRHASATHAPRRRLRVGIVLCGRLVEERLLPADTRVTVGRSLRATLCIPEDAAPLHWSLFEVRRGRLVLRIPHGARATVAAGSTVTTLAPAPADAVSGRAARAASDIAPSAPLRPREGIGEPPADFMLLPDRARGRIEIGAATVLFQIVSPPPARPRPQLPPSLRASAVHGLDGLFSALVAVCFLLHTAIVLYLRAVDWPRRPAPETLPDRFVSMVIRRPPPPPGPTTEPPNETATSEKAPPRQRPRREPKPTPRAPAPTSAERRAALAEKARSTGLLAVLGRLGDEPGALADLLRGGAADRDQEEALRGVNGVATATDAPGLHNLLRTPAEGRVATISELRGAGDIARAARIEGPAERRVSAIVKHDPPSVDGSLDPALLSRELRARLGALRACYERALKRNPQLGGKLLVRFTITPAGTVTSLAVDEDTLGDAEVRACILAAIGRWRFPAPAGGAAEVSFPFIFQPAS